MKKIEKTENQIVFIAKIEETLANAIRRYVDQISVLAFDEVEISRNDSALYDETIAHRIGLIPIKAEKSKKPKESKLETKKEGTVYSEELEGDVQIIYPKMPLTTLSKGQELKLTATITSGKGADHAKFTPGFIFYRNVLEVEVGKEFYEKIKEICPGNEIKEKGNKITIIDDRKKEVADVCEGIVNKKGQKAEIETKDELVITLESFGQISVEDIFKNSIDVLKKDLNEISKKVSKI